MKRVCRILMIIGTLTGGLLSQTTQSAFLIRAESGGQSSILPSGSTINLVAEALNTAKSANLTFTYQGTRTAIVTQLDLLGSADLTLQGRPSLPVTLRPGDVVPVVIQYVPKASQAVQAVLTMGFSEATAAGGSTPGSIVLNIIGTAPGFSLAYVLQADSNTVSIPEGGVVLFPTTPSGGNNLANILAINNGTAPLTIVSVALTPSGPGTDFQIIGLPLLPAAVGPGQVARFTIRYAPRTSGSHTASLRIGLQDRTIDYGVQGSSTGPSFSYELIEGTTTSSLVPNVPFSLPDTELGTTRSFVIRVTNQGDGDGIIQQISVLGPGFQVADLPFLPLTLTAGSSFFFTLNFTPVQPGPAIGRLRIGSDNFEFSAQGLGARLTYTYNNGGVSVSVQPNGNISFNPVTLGRQTQINFTINNTGTTDAVIASIFTASTSEFTVLNIPNLPTRLKPNESLPLVITFSPTTVGPANSTLRVDSQTFNLLGVGSRPPDLSGYQFGGASGTVDPLQQVPLSLTLNAPYPLPLTGTLTMNFTSAGFAVDPALQFASGGRTLNFRIPANTTSAIFPNNQAQIGLQTGTVAGTITITPNFTVANNFNLTTSAGDLQLTIPSKAPSVLSVDVVPQGTTAMTLFVTGYASSRTLTRLNLQFVPKSGTTLQGGDVTVDMSSSSTIWFRNAGSQNFGSLFTLTVPFSVQGVDPAATLAQIFESVSATLANELGTSSSISTKLQ